MFSFDTNLIACRDRLALRLFNAPLAKVALPVLAAGALWTLGGCGSGKTASEAQPALAEAATAVPTATSAPTPTPTPDVQKIPVAAEGKVFSKVPVRKTDKVFALTFDDGPWPESTREILAILKENDVKATFFMVGQEIKARPNIAREVKAAGHAIGNHSWSHPSRPRDPAAEVLKTDEQLRRIGVKTTIFRPPYGILKNGMAREAEREKQAVLIWSADAADWKRPSPEHIAMMITGQASPGGIALMHDGGGDRSHTVAALPVIISTLRARGYRFVTIPELLALRYVEPKAKPKSKKTAKKSH